MSFRSSGDCLFEPGQCKVMFPQPSYHYLNTNLTHHLKLIKFKFIHWWFLLHMHLWTQAC